MKEWNIVVDKVPYKIEVKGNKVMVNGIKIKLGTLVQERRINYSAWNVPVGDTSVTLYGPGTILKSEYRLVRDGKDCETDEVFQPKEKAPGWSIVFIIIHCINFINGAVGIGLAIVGTALTISIATNRKLPLVVRVLLCILLVIVSAAIIYWISIALANALYS